MSISRQIGWNDKEKLLYDIYNKFRRANGLAYKWTQGDFFQQGSNVNPLPPENAIRFEGTNELIHFENDETEQYIIFETS